MATSLRIHICTVTITVLCILQTCFSSPLQTIPQNWIKDAKPSGPLNCSLPSELVDEIASYSSLFQQVSDLVFNGPLKGATYDNLATFADTFGPRLVGSQPLEDAIDYLVNFMNESGLENVHTEDAQVLKWERGNESLYLIEPRFHQLALLGLGSSIGTAPEGITAEVIVVDSFDELDENSDRVAGKIVVYNEPFYFYGQAVQYRAKGASNAAKYGAVAALIRSVTPHSIYSPHTGWQTYEDGVKKIPAACITIEDAEMFKRMQDRGTKITVKLTMEAGIHGQGISRNTIGERVGTTNPEEVVIVSGHADSWDVGQGAMDDGGGAFISLMVPIVINTLNLRPRRTLRTVLWTGEEQDFNGAIAYSIAHHDELADFDLVLESDDGTFDIQGLTFSGSKDAACIMHEVLKLSSALNASQLLMPDDGSDTFIFSSLGVTTGSLNSKDDVYFNYHHSNGDTMTVEDSGQLDRSLVFWAVTSYVVADLSVRLPRDNTTTSTT